MLEWVIVLGVYLRIIAVAAFIFYIIPMQYKEIKIKDDLNFVRWAIFVGLILCTLSTIVTLSYNIYRVNFDENLQFYMNITSIITSFKDLLIAIILMLIYNKNYKEIS